MKIRVTLQLSDNTADYYGLAACQRELVYSTTEGEWVQFSFGGLMDQSWSPLVDFDRVEGVYRTPDGAVWSDIIVSFDSEVYA